MAHAAALCAAERAAAAAREARELGSRSARLKELCAAACCTPAEGQPIATKCLKQQCSQCRGCIKVTPLPPEVLGRACMVQLEQWQRVEVELPAAAAAAPAAGAGDGQETAVASLRKQVKLVRTMVNAEQLADRVREVLSKLLWHQRVAEHQAAEWHRCVDSMRPGDCMIAMDYSENAALAPGEEIQNNYFRRVNSTLLIAISWHWPTDAPAPIKTVHAFISPDKKHDHK